jgi:hypothetical protein
MHALPKKKKTQREDINAWFMHVFKEMRWQFVCEAVL